MYYIFTENFSEGDPMLSFYQYYDQANYSYESFIQIRYDDTLN